MSREGIVQAAGGVEEAAGEKWMQKRLAQYVAGSVF
jgi:hypothetical protein